MSCLYKVYDNSLIHTHFKKNKIKEKRQRRVTSSQGNKWNSKTETNNLSFSTLVNFIWRNFFVLARNIIIIYLAKNSDGSVKYMVHNGPCLVTGYRRLFLCFFSFLCQPLTFIRLDNDLVTLGLSLSDLISCSLPTIVYMLCIVASDDVIFIFFPASSSSKNCIPQLWMVARGVAWVELKDLCKLTW